MGITDVKVGSGPTAAVGDQAFVQYRGTLASNGKEFDSNMSATKDPFAFAIGQGAVIKGWDMGLVGMKVGGERKLRVPSSLGYGPNGSGDKIPPNSDLDFDIKLLALVKAGEENVIDTEEIKPGRGSRKVKEGDTVTIKYTGRLLNGKVVTSSDDAGKPFTFLVDKKHTISGMDTGVRGMKVGEVRKISMPPETTAGMQSRSPMTPGSYVVFEVELVSIK